MLKEAQPEENIYISKAKTKPRKKRKKKNYVQKLTPLTLLETQNTTSKDLNSTVS